MRARAVPSVLVTVAVLVPLASAAPASARSKRDCSRTSIGGTTLTVNTFGGGKLKTPPQCSLARKILRSADRNATPNGRARRISGWSCRIYAPDYGGTAIQCQRRGRLIMGYDDQYGE